MEVIVRAHVRISINSVERKQGWSRWSLTRPALERKLENIAGGGKVADVEIYLKKEKEREGKVSSVKQRNDERKIEGKRKKLPDLTLGIITLELPKWSK